MNGKRLLPKSGRAILSGDFPHELSHFYLTRIIFLTQMQILHRAKRGFGFVLRGAKAASPLMQLKPSPRCPALQYLDDVDPGGVADMAGLLPGDFLLAVSVKFFHTGSRLLISRLFFLFPTSLALSDKWRRCHMCIA